MVPKSGVVVLEAVAENTKGVELVAAEDALIGAVEDPDVTGAVAGGAWAEEKYC